MTETDLWRSLPMPALVLDARDQIVAVNPAAEDFLNLSSKGLVGQGFWMRVFIDEGLPAAFDRARATASALYVNESDLGTPERETVRCSLHFAPLEGADGQMLLIITVRDQSGRSGSAPTASARSAIGMSEMLAHEIKNPLAGITGAAQLLSMTLSAKDQELTDLIVAESKRIVGLLDQVEQFGNLQPPGDAPVNVHDILDRVRTSALVGFGAHMVITREYDPSLPPTRGDAGQLTQALLNLVKNASEAQSSGGKIKLRTFYDPGPRLRRADGTAPQLPLQIEVCDDGPGIPDDIAGDIFDPFVSGHENGSGLGLALVSKIISDHGGLLTLDSAPGKTVFRLSLPVAPPQSLPDAP